MIVYKVIMDVTTKDGYHDNDCGEFFVACLGEDRAIEIAQNKLKRVYPDSVLVLISCEFECSLLDYDSEKSK